MTEDCIKRHLPILGAHSETPAARVISACIELWVQWIPVHLQLYALSVSVKQVLWDLKGSL